MSEKINEIYKKANEYYNSKDYMNAANNFELAANFALRENNKEKAKEFFIASIKSNVYGKNFKKAIDLSDSILKLSNILSEKALWEIFFKSMKTAVEYRYPINPDKTDDMEEEINNIKWHYNLLKNLMEKAINFAHAGNCDEECKKLVLKYLKEIALYYKEKTKNMIYMNEKADELIYNRYIELFNYIKNLNI